MNFLREIEKTKKCPNEGNYSGEIYNKFLELPIHKRICFNYPKIEEKIILFFLSKK